jgi:hypothetical protein
VDSAGLDGSAILLEALVGCILFRVALLTLLVGSDVMGMVLRLVRLAFAPALARTLG